MKTRPVGAEFFHVDRRKNGHEKGNSRFSQFYQSAEKRLESVLIKTRIILLFARITSFHVYVLCHNDVLTFIIHALHCYGQWLIVASYCASLNP